jgi:hypothetical protein
MSSTNKTTNYELSQFIGSDKPAWLTDYNQDMTKIDTGIHTAQAAATGADGKADANTTNIGDLTYLSTTAKNNLVAAVNEVDNKAETAQGTATNASIQSTSALNTAQTALANTALLNLTDIKNVAASSFTDITNFTNMGGSLTVAANNDGSVFKLYGSITFKKQFGTSSFKFNTSIRPTTEFTISPIGFYVEDNGYIRTINAKIATNGDVTISVYGGDIQNSHDAIFSPCIYFAKDFNDTPITQ